ncbi:alpha/beta hydrolase [Rhodococcus aerolatus]
MRRPAARRPLVPAARRPLVPAALLVVGALALAGCGATTVEGGSAAAGTTAPATSAPLTSQGPTGAVPAGLEAFYGQTLTWGSCVPFVRSPADEQAFADPSLDCGRLTVPLDYADPGGPTASVAVLRHRASGQRVGSLFLNPGGPGASGTSFAASEAGALADTEVGRRFDLVGLDPRGVAATEPAITCNTGPEADAQRADDDVDESPAGIAQTEAEEQQFVDRCVARTGTDVLAHVGTRENARDLDVARSVLGDEQLSYLGYSYGTRLGTEYAAAFPTQVRAMVLDGAVDPGADPIDDLVRQGAGFQQAFTAYAARCATQPTCPLGTDPAGVTARYRALVDPLLRTPAATTDPRGLSYADANTGVLQALYSQQLWPSLTRGLGELAQGRGDTLLRLADLYEDRAADGSYTNQSDAFTAIRCVDDPPVTDRAATGVADTRYRQAAPFLDDGLGTGNAALDVCAFWPVPPTGTVGEVDPRGLTTTLVVSTTGDPATPYQAGVDLARQLDAALLTFEGTQHTVALQGDTCVDDAVTAYLVAGTLPAAGARC